MKNATIKIAGSGCLALLSFGTFNLSCFAENSMSDSSFGNGTGTFKMIIEVIFFLALILGLFYVAVRLLSKRNQLFQSTRSVKTLGGVSLGQNKSMQLVEVGHRLYVLGVGDNVQLLDTIEDPDEIAFIREHLVLQSNVKLDQLFAWSKRLPLQRKSAADDEDVNAEPSFQQVFHDKMRRISARRQDVEQLMNNDLKRERRLDDQ